MSKAINELDYRLLVTYLKLYDKNYPDLHPACQTFVEPKRKLESTVSSIQPGTLGTSGSGGKFPNILTNAVAKVRMLSQTVF